MHIDRRFLFLSILILLLMPLAIAFAERKVGVSLTVTDINGQPLPDPVPIGITAYAHGYYEDLTGQDRSAIGWLLVYYKPSEDGGWQGPTWLFSGTVASGSTTTRSHKLEGLGDYKFVWIVFGEIFFRIVHTRIGPVLPEPATLLGLLVSLAALGIVFSRKPFSKQK